MASIMVRRIDQNPRHTLSDAGRLNCLAPSGIREVPVGDRYEFVDRALTGADSGGGHLDFLVAGDDTSGQWASTVTGLATASAALTDDNIAMHAVMARTAHAGFEEIAGWFQPRTKAGHSEILEI
jgi:hypothetical protein